MDARWGNSGQRVKAAVAITLEPGGRVSIMQEYQMGLTRRLPDPVGIGWTVEGREHTHIHTHTHTHTCMRECSALPLKDALGPGP
jgi:hypothetical protein